MDEILADLTKQQAYQQTDTQLIGEMGKGGGVAKV